MVPPPASVPAATGPVVEVRHAGDLSPGELDDWRALDDANPVSVNPFLCPEWVLSWYEAFVPDLDDRVVVTVRHRKTGELVGLAPLHRQVLKVGPLTVSVRLVPVGAGIVTSYEMPGFLAAAGQHRDVLREVVQAVLATDARWGGVAVGQDQGWFEPEHLMVATRPGRRPEVDFWQLVKARGCVVLRLQPTWEATAATLKRNLKESLRRSRNRLEKSGRGPQVHRRSGAEIDDAAVRRFLDLHRQRSANEQASVDHPDTYAGGANRQLMLLALPRLAARDRVSIFELELDGRVVAAQLALHASGSSYVHSSGFHPDVWTFGPVTHLVGELVRHAVDRGDRVVNFSPGPRVSKLRWSEEVWSLHEFVFGLAPRATLSRYLLLQAASALFPEKAGIEVTARPASEKAVSAGP